MIKLFLRAICVRKSSVSKYFRRESLKFEGENLDLKFDMLYCLLSVIAVFTWHFQEAFRSSVIREFKISTKNPRTKFVSHVPPK